MKKKIVSMLLCTVMATALAAGCGSQKTDDAAAPADNNAAPETEGEASAPTAAPETEGETSAPAAASAGSTADIELTYDGEPIELLVTQHDPENSATGEFLNDWKKIVEEKSQGKLILNINHGGTLAGPKDTYDYVLNGTADIGWGLQSFYADVFPVSEVFSLPMIDIDNAIQGSTAIWNFYKSTDYMDAEYENFHVLLLHTNCQSPISFVGDKIETVEDLASLQCRANAGPPTTFAQNLGMTPVSIAITELYQALQTGACESVMTDWHAISSFKLNEVCKNFLDENLGVSTYFMVMNKDKYESLPEDLQKILDAASEEAIAATDAWQRYEDTVRDTITSANPDAIYTFSDEEHDKLKAVADETIQQWIESMNGKGYDGQAIYDEAMACLEAAK
ncbi:MAG: TRAP transporter substrate-binding protein [Eubacterium sp.]|nr:TRAP transporter substrate-binding protein [Eubacterium sp.]